jgi:undecaprenyl-diphosphatase
LVSFGIVGIIVAVLVPALRPRIVFSIVTTLVAWQASDALKNVFARPRPDYWILHHETTASYPSGHAMFAIVVYGLWSYYIATGSLPRGPRIILSSCFALWALAVIWSRLALGAHYVTDVIGGVLFGIMMLAIAVAVYGRIPALPARLTEYRRSSS